MDIDNTVNTSVSILSSLFSKQCPLLTKTVRKRSSTSKYWYSTELHELKREKRRQERRWLKNQSITNTEQYDHAKQVYKKALYSARDGYITKQADENLSNPKALYKFIKKFLGDDKISTFENRQQV